MDSSFIRKSNLTREEYDYFKTVRIYNMYQAAAYADAGVFPIDIRTDINKDGKRVIVFYYVKEATKEVFDKWCNHEL